MASMNLVSPWVEYYRQVEALFKEDPFVDVVYDDSKTALNLYVSENTTKAGVIAGAIRTLLPETKEFGNVNLYINVYPNNEDVFTSMFKSIDKNVIESAFTRNAAVIGIKTVYLQGKPFTYVIFKREVVQYFTDDIGDIHGIHSTLYQNIANGVLNDHPGIFFCTDTQNGDLPF